MDYIIQESKIDKETMTVLEKDSTGQIQHIPKSVPAQVLAIRFKKILQTITRHGVDGEEEDLRAVVVVGVMPAVGLA